MVAAPAKPVQQKQNNAPGTLFGLPGVTMFSEQKENNDGTKVTLSQTTQTDVTFSAPFKQTDIVAYWEMDVSLTVAVTVGAPAITLSDYFPYSVFNTIALNFQNQFDAYDLQAANGGGIDAAIFQLIRPRRRLPHPNVLDQNYTGSAYSSQVFSVTASNYTVASTAINFTLDLTPSVDFDAFYIMNIDGSLASGVPIRGTVGMLPMAGSDRIVTPRIRFNALAGNDDAAPYKFPSGSTGTATGTATLGFRRRIVYQPDKQNPAEWPLLFNWQYIRQTRKIALSGTSGGDFSVPFAGQIMSVYCRFFDPSANSNLGAPIDMSTLITEISLLYGSGLYRFQDNYLTMQRRFARQHGIILPAGVLCWDMAITDMGQVSNQFLLNTLNTSAVTIRLVLNATLSATAYMVVGIEGLKYVVSQ